MIYRDERYHFRSGGFTKSKRWNHWNFHLCSLWYDIFNYPNPTKWISKLVFLILLTWYFKLDFFPVWNQLDIFSSSNWFFFRVSMLGKNILMNLAKLFTPFLQFTEIYITNFWSSGFTTATAMNKKDKKLGKSIFVHFDMTFLTTLTGIFDFADLIFQTSILQAKNPV